MTMIIAIISILILTAVFAALRKFRIIKMCPICSGVSGTWLWMLAARQLGYPLDSLALGILMGGSVVGAAYRLEKHLAPHHSLLLWKTLFIPAGFTAVYFLLQSQIPTFIAAAVGMGVIAFVFLRWGNGKSSVTKELEEKLKQCC